jgi:hypothetical protein
MARLDALVLTDPGVLRTLPGHSAKNAAGSPAVRSYYFWDTCVPPVIPEIPASAFARAGDPAR